MLNVSILLLKNSNFLSTELHRFRKKVAQQVLLRAPTILIIELFVCIFAHD